ncbi:MAG: bifunctional precorrin-2 dehydrogenase/sirohydrochlorin ferrochelatase [Lachnospiraceae bacterium]
MSKTEKYFFPLFMDLREKKLLIFGAGKVVARRIRSLLGCGADIRVVAPEILPEVEQMCEQCEKDTEEQTRIRIEHRSYRLNEIQDADYVFAATNDISVNTTIFRECRHKEVPVNVASDHTLCTFFFPAIIEANGVFIGLTSGGADHKKVRRTREKIEQWLRQEENDAAGTNRNKRE